MSAYLAISRVDIAGYLQTLLYVYIVLIFIRILLTWLPRIPYNPVLNAVLKFVQDVTDPFLNIFRRILPPLRMGPGAIDLSPMIATFVLIIVGGIVVNLVHG
jgi:YggT family protein